MPIVQNLKIEFYLLENVQSFISQTAFLKSGKCKTRQIARFIHQIHNKEILPQFITGNISSHKECRSANLIRKIVRYLRTTTIKKTIYNESAIFMYFYFTYLTAISYHFLYRVSGLGHIQKQFAKNGPDITLNRSFQDTAK